MASEKRGHISRPSQYLSTEDGSMGQSSSLIVLPCRHATIIPCSDTLEQHLPNHQRTPPCRTNDIYRSNSGVFRIDRRTCTQRSSLTGVRRIGPTSSNSRSALSAPRGLVTYLQLCRPIVPKERAISSAIRSQIPYIHKTRVDNTLKHITLNPGLAVYGIPLGQVQSCSQNVKQGVEK
ncbi:hypothetical protein GDO81_005987, partial [Engystomops pustulosus]